MKKLLFILILLVVFTILSTDVLAQCSICTRTAEQLGEKPARGLNTGILYLAATPLAIVGFISYRMWKNHKNQQ
ncbi:MAG TPA: hypothetical protein VGE66_12995 [Chitinophagaceae bacterium]